MGDATPGRHRKQQSIHPHTNSTQTPTTHTNAQAHLGAPPCRGPGAGRPARCGQVGGHQAPRHHRQGEQDGGQGRHVGRRILWMDGKGGLCVSCVCATGVYSLAPIHIHPWDRQWIQARFYQIRKDQWRRFESWNLEDHHQVQHFEVRGAGVDGCGFHLGLIAHPSTTPAHKHKHTHINNAHTQSYQTPYPHSPKITKSTHNA